MGTEGELPVVEANNLDPNVWWAEGKGGRVCWLQGEEFYWTCRDER